MLHGIGELFDHLIEGQAHAVCCVASTSRKAYAWFVLRTMGQVNCLAFCIGGVVFVQVGMFVLCCSDAVIKEQVVTFAQLS